MGTARRRAEEAAQEAFAIAAERWPREGTPVSPAALLITTARHRAIDRVRRERTLAAKTHLLEPAEGEEDDVPDPFDQSSITDERLELMFACCHPALAVEAQVALTLGALGGLSTEEIASAFLVTPDTMKRRLSRARAKIKHAGIPFAVPPDRLLPERLAAVLAVVYLIFNQGYGGRDSLAAEAISLARVLASLLPDESEVHGLLALMLLHDARRRARYAGGELVLMDDQDRRLWDAGQIGAGRAILDRALGPARPRPVRAPGRDRRPPARGSHRLAPDRRALPGARRADRLPGGGAQPRGRGGTGRRPVGGPGHH